jgi:hypothetical protein
VVLPKIKCVRGNLSKVSRIEPAEGDSTDRIILHCAYMIEKQVGIKNALLSISRIVYGGGDQDRTDGLLIAKQTVKSSYCYSRFVSGTAVRYSKKQTLEADEIRLPASGCLGRDKDGQVLNLNNINCIRHQCTGDGRASSLWIFEHHGQNATGQQRRKRRSITPR